MVYLIAGENLYESWKYAKQVASKINEDALVKIVDGEEIGSINDLIRASEEISIFGDSEIIIAKRFLRNKKTKLHEELVNYLESEQEINLILWESSKIDKRKSSYKNLRKLVEYKEFNKLDKRSLTRWSKGLCKSMKLNIKQDDLDYIIEHSNDDQYIIESELNKLFLFKEAKKLDRLTKSDIEEVVSDSKSTQIWDLMRTIETNNRRKRQKLLNNLLTQGEPPLAILGMLARHFRILIQVRYLLEKEMQPSEIQHTLNLHPFVIRKAIAQARGIGLIRLKRYYNKLLATDLAIKDGQLEDELALTLFVGIL